MQNLETKMEYLNILGPNQNKYEYEVAIIEFKPKSQSYFQIINKQY